jgi:prevent-host-death family protein
MEAKMKLSESVKPISYFKAHASEIVRQIADRQQPMVITQNGEAKAVLQDIVQYEQTQESLAMLKMLAQSRNSLKNGDHKPVADVFSNLKKKIREDHKIRCFYPLHSRRQTEYLGNSSATQFEIGRH